MRKFTTESTLSWTTFNFPFPHIEILYNEVFVGDETLFTFKYMDNEREEWGGSNVSSMKIYLFVELLTVTKLYQKTRREQNFTCFDS